MHEKLLAKLLEAAFAIYAVAATLYILYEVIIHILPLIIFLMVAVGIWVIWSWRRRY
jgi:hypothetical protein